MRLAPMFLGLLAGLPLACGGRVGSHDGAGEAGDAGTGDDATGATGGESQAIVGRVYATTSSWAPSDYFDVQLQPVTSLTASCAGATTTVGACCYFPPSPPPPDPLPGDGGGTVATETNAGAITLLDGASNAPLGTFGYSGWGYMTLPLSAPDIWHPGDVLTVNAAGDQLAAFTVSAPALIPPSVQAPVTIGAGRGVAITWQPDPNADAMTIILDDEDHGGIVACSAPDAQGTLTMDGSLFATFHSGDLCQGTAERETIRYVQTSSGRVAFVSGGWASFEASIQ